MNYLTMMILALFACQQIVVKWHTVDRKVQRLIDFNQWVINFINSWLEFQSTVDKIYQPLIETYQPFLSFKSDMNFEKDP